MYKIPYFAASAHISGDEFAKDEALLWVPVAWIEAWSAGAWWNSRGKGGNVVAKDGEIHFQQVFL